MVRKIVQSEAMKRVFDQLAAEHEAKQKPVASVSLAKNAAFKRTQGKGTAMPSFLAEADFPGIDSTRFNVTVCVVRRDGEDLNHADISSLTEQLHASKGAKQTNAGFSVPVATNTAMDPDVYDVRVRVVRRDGKPLSKEERATCERLNATLAVDAEKPAKARKKPTAPKGTTSKRKAAKAPR